MADFLAKLKQIEGDAKAKASRDFSGGLDRLAAIMDVLLRRKLFLKDDDQYYCENIPQVAEDLAFTAGALDAAATLDELVMNTPNGSVHDIEVPSRHRGHILDVKDYIHSQLTELPDRGFSYVAWTWVPQKFYYVGRASGKGRVKHLFSHGQLSAAMNKATTLSLLYPSQSTEDNLWDLEAALLYLLAYVGNPPEYNTKDEAMTKARRGKKSLQALSQLFYDIACELQPEQVR
ncbi:MAG: hypothetical protein ABSE73_14150 [Planctomycetota bacterium]